MGPSDASFTNLVGRFALDLSHLLHQCNVQLVSLFCHFFMIQVEFVPIIFPVFGLRLEVLSGLLLVIE